MSMIIPPKEIINNVRFRNNTVILVGKVNEEQQRIFEEFKKKVDKEHQSRFEDA